MELNFEFGKPFDEKTTDGRDCTTTVQKVSDTRWTIVQKNKKAGGIDVNVVRDFSDKGVNVEMTAGDVTCKQFFERQ